LMTSKLNLIVMIDDDNLQNLINQKIISRLACAQETKVFQHATDALDYFRSALQGDLTLPELVLLDINMPKMNGWEFLDIFKNIQQESDYHPVIFMLTSSLHPQDLDTAKTYSGVKEFVNKPLTIESFSALIEAYFH
ncbi:MAG: response regulator, partial [Bacteroidota bacterium]